MMKRKLLAVVLPLVGCATVVGSGFAAWYFGDIEADGANPKAAITSVNVTKEVMSAKGLLNLESTTDTVDGQFLVLDQGGIKSDETQGIMIGTVDDNETKAKSGVDYSFTLTWGSTGDGEKVDLFQIYEAGMKVQLTVTIELTGNLSNYIEMVSKYSLKYGDGVAIAKEFTAKDNIYTAVWEPEEPVSGTTNASWNFNLGFDTNEKLQNEAFKYKKYAAGKDGAFTGKPSNKGEPAKMANDLAGSSEEEGEPKEAATVKINVVAKLVNTKPVVDNEN